MTKTAEEATPDRTVADSLRLAAEDGHRFFAYRSQPKEGKPRGGLVVIQEIFGVNRHIRQLADSYAAAGYLTLAPALFDRIEPGLEYGYDSKGIATGRSGKEKVGNEKALADIGAAVNWLAGEGLPVAAVGFCWGGLLAWLAAARLPLAGAAAFYGGGIEKVAAANPPKAPIQLHYGLKDGYIDEAARAAARAAAPAAEYFEYPADHGFCCDERGSHHAESAALGRVRVLDFLHRVVG